MIVDTGLDLIKDLVNGDSSSNLTHGAVGTDNTAPTSADTALGGENTRKTFEGYTDDDRETIFEIWIASTEGNGVTLQEVGLFNAGAGGDMLARSTFTGIAKDATKELLVEYKVVYSDES